MMAPVGSIPTSSCFTSSLPHDALEHAHCMCKPVCVCTHVLTCACTHVLTFVCLLVCIHTCWHYCCLLGKWSLAQKAPQLKQDHRLPTYVLCVHMCVCVLHFILYGRKFWREEYLADCSNNGIWRILLWQLGKPFTIIIWKWILVRQPAQQNNIKSTLTLTRFEP